MTTIEALPDLAMLNIFDRLPLTDLLSTGRVCTLFDKFRRDSCRTRHSLILMVSPKLVNQTAKIKGNLFGVDIPHWKVLENDDGSKMYDLNSKQRQFHTFETTNSLSMEFVEFLVDLFGEIFELEIYIGAESIKNMEPLIEMLKRCASNITLLRLHLGYESGKFDRFLVKNIGPHVRLLTVINNSMPALRRLELYVNVSLVKSRYARINFPVLAQLERFVFQSVDHFDFVLDSVKRFAALNENLTGIQIRSFVQDHAALLRFERDFSARFAVLNLTVRPHNVNQLATLFERFHNLTYLSLYFTSRTQINRDAFYRSLLPLTQLIYISFDVTALDMMDFTFDPAEGEIVNQQIRLPSIKVITYVIHGDIESHQMFASFRMGHIFPNLQVAELKFNHSTLCQECQRNNVEPSKVEDDCIVPMMRTLKLALPKLKRILTTEKKYTIFRDI